MLAHRHLGPPHLGRRATELRGRADDLVPRRRSLPRAPQERRAVRRRPRGPDRHVVRCAGGRDTGGHRRKHRRPRAPAPRAGSDARFRCGRQRRRPRRVEARRHRDRRLLGGWLVQRACLHRQAPRSVAPACVDRVAPNPATEATAHRRLGTGLRNSDAAFETSSITYASPSDGTGSRKAPRSSFFDKQRSPS
jgi:hypothetical protein